jgi:A/G-specific adenine glycosylase
MLQQTQVARVVPKFLAFVEQFPDPTACAGVAPGEVVRAWAGLGYNRRALNLHRAAVAVTFDLDGRFPDTLTGLLALPGVGPYTARAILAYAYEADAAVVDTNVARVLARHAGRPLSARDVQAAADASLPAGEAWAWNQAMMDLGASVCTARRAACAACPFALSCAWRGGGDDPARDPAPDPAIGSAGVSGGQSRFAGSDRQGRGRLVAALRSGAVAEHRLAATMGWPDDQARAIRVAATLVHDGLAVVTEASYHLP